MARGYDEETERRRLRERDTKPPFARWLDRVFFTGGEMLGLSIPAILAAIYVPAAPNAVQSGQILAFAVAVSVAATIRCGWVDVGRSWPATTARTVLARTAWYPAIMVLGPFAGPRVWNASGTIAAPLVVALASGIVMAAGVPWVGALVSGDQ